MTTEDWLRAIERDRREPDKVLLNVASLRRHLFDLVEHPADYGRDAENYYDNLED